MNEKTRGIKADVEKIIGKRYDKLIILSEALPRKNRWGANHTYVNTICDCGVESEKKLSDLNFHFSKGYHNRCSKCSRKSKMDGDFLKNTWFNNIIQGARVRNLEVSIDIEFCEILWKTQQGKCALSGVDLVPPLKTSITKEGNKSITYSGDGSLDRIDSSIGYTKGNVQWVHKNLNTMKMSMTQEDFINWCKLIANNHERST